ncbi:conserved hypothetical protein [Beutenbergia cavernae DSM 12333]|uniref:Integral membrane protein n=1 Tax=Beutenbergia cavernae (strain ATCC BAA-8 / DSM 12333 / CCUG 43141 / JCM 11478 / NBRC 16432 / NCIMB 13614 / HKI 0122) TaxID=471853 RepID=C5BXB8_BEUC1|nr:glycosyltransferase 87 family protein [Beutenbergia cavernae]ACQ78793.1 conserved hypothetical protein [Beutenbergia cavernae DSM 12333]
MRRAGRSAALFWAAFLAVHALLAVAGAGAFGRPAFFDVDLYRQWIEAGLQAGVWPVLDTPWVYPVGALLPLLPLAAVASSPTGAVVVWCVLVTALDGVASVVLRRHLPAGVGAAWWWLAFVLALGPVGMGRLDAVVAALMVPAFAVATTRPALASALLTLVAWIKATPGVAFLALVAAVRERGRAIVAAAAGVSVLVVGTALALGAGGRVLDFVLEQGSRGLQVEAVAATPYVLARLVSPAVTIVFDPLVTYEVHGPGADGVALALDVALPVAVAVVTWLVWRSRRGLTSAGALAWGAFALLLVAVVVNKVLSPQYVAWLAPPVAVALGRAAGRVRWRRVAAWTLVAAFLTQLVYPIGYPDLLAGSAVWAWVLAARNAVLVGLLVVALRVLVAAGRRRRREAESGRTLRSA